MLANVTAMTQDTDASLEVTRISACDQQWFEIALPSERVWAERAFSCTVMPQVDDKVLISRQASGDCFILAILQRSGATQSMDMVFPGDVTLQSLEGKIAVNAGTDVVLNAGQRVAALSPELVFQAESTRLTSRQLDISGQKANLRVQEGRLYAGRLDSVVGALTQCAQTVSRKVEGIETLNVGAFFKTVRQTLTIRANHAVISSRHDMKMDAERIHMG